MKVYVHFDSQVRRLAGCSNVTLDVDEDTPLLEVIQRVGNSGTGALRSALMDEHDSVRPSLLIFLNNELVAKEKPCVLQDGAELTLTTLISGG